MSAGLIFFRRTSVTPARDEYLFLTIESIETSLTNRLIAPTLPGNDSTLVAGANSTNFIFNIGSQQLQMSLKGTIQQIAGGSYPASLPGTARYLPGFTTTVPALTIDGGTGARAYDIRDSLLDFVADQAHSNYNSFAMGYLNWNPNGSISNPGEYSTITHATFGTTGKTYITIDGLSYRLFTGQIRDLKFTELPTDIAAFGFSMTFQVGSNT